MRHYCFGLAYHVSMINKSGERAYLAQFPLLNLPLFLDCEDTQNVDYRSLAHIYSINIRKF